MADVQQLDIFAYLQEIEEQAAAQQPAPAPVPMKQATVRTPFLKRLGAALSWFWIVAHNLFGLARWVNVYTVTRGFGGREAGGWYYLRYECEKSRKVGFWEASVLRMKWLDQYSSLRWGDIRSKNGGQDVMVCIEPRRAARRTIRPPRFDEYADQAIPYSLIQGGN
jgi:hypothetical protein